MKKTLLTALLVFCTILCYARKAKPRVFIFTDININKGDPDDRQSLVHLLWYADELDIQGIVPDRWNAQGMEASLMAIEAYEKDYQKYRFKRKGYPSAQKLKDLLAKDTPDAVERLRKAAFSSQEPLYVLVWGNMVNFGKALKQHPEISQKIRLITIGTGLKYGPEDEVAGEQCNVPNWNGPGRNEIFEDPRFRDMWWLEINWTYNGMFSGEGPKQMFAKLSTYGEMGQHMQFVTKDHPWAQYFRVGDTPSVLYLLNPAHNPDDPTQSSWAGKFKKPFPQERPHYYTDDNGPVEWDYANPCRTWNNIKEMYAYNKSTLEKERPAMYKALLEKLDKTYGKGN
jgi:hypothetical protein